MGYHPAFAPFLYIAIVLLQCQRKLPVKKLLYVLLGCNCRSLMRTARPALCAYDMRPEVGVTVPQSIVLYCVKVWLQAGPSLATYNRPSTKQIDHKSIGADSNALCDATKQSFRLIEGDSFLSLAHHTLPYLITSRLTKMAFIGEGIAKQEKYEALPLCISFRRAAPRQSVQASTSARSLGLVPNLSRPVLVQRCKRNRASHGLRVETPGTIFRG